ncbi:EAL domain-containing protein [Laribacter hongkongensis]|uniref:EAL domain-containing protein n=1 Tax=Laribacter hongkongensis TaxID=168471 RepID=A0ABD4SWA3_9NEIS|nr:LapD/MoxY N-terminal periplasmic domain-containing protein [Laribacter hongkongensis]MCG9026821.1 EAL domain-containing protein [Laribacter hongkongensis]MCG9059454.1 EAL domain-containing protein [Laribacter hongkongensis]MCG9065244.1 EAL domain-containing protein [Laribacter hongkongensis]MCG9078193.1 EAL domain-containing protein [Laribacter hongkongensis]MCG9084192.1 EAL domain-containing protein [Laribacter hongkongensis]
MKHPTLIQRLWLLLLLLVFLAFSGTLLANLMNARSYLEQQLTAQNANTANSLALMVSQQRAEPVMAETLISATFDQGHYSLIRWQSSTGQVRVERQRSTQEPGWLPRLLELRPQPGRAMINAGWMQAGDILVETDPGVAYASLQKSLLQTLMWLLLAGLVTGAIGSRSILRLRSDLNRVTEQAQAISNHRFFQIPEPPVPELAQVVQAMNRMVAHLQSYLAGLTREVDTLRRERLTDRTTGVANREALEQTYSSLQAQEGGASGWLLLLRAASLTELNQRLGGQRADALLKHLAQLLEQASQRGRHGLAARLRGADFALLCPEIDQTQAESLARQLAGELALCQQMGLSDQENVAHMGLTPFAPGESLPALLGRANHALTQAEAQGVNRWQLDSSNAVPVSSEHDWRELIETACRQHELQLRWYPVIGRDRQVRWQEGMLYRPAQGSEPAINALRLLSHSLRLNLTHLPDLAALHCALQAHDVGPVRAINLSPASLAHPRFLPSITESLGSVRGLQLSFEFHEIGLTEHWEAFLAFSQAIRMLGHRVAVEILGHNLELVARLNSSGISYLVIDGSLTRDIDQDAGRQNLLRGLLRMTGLMSVELIAKGVSRPEDLATLIELGVDGLTGPAVTP